MEIRKSYLDGLDGRKLLALRYDYSDAINQGIVTETLPSMLSVPLSPGMDIFSDLPSTVFQNRHAALFLEAMRRCLSSWDTADSLGIVLSKLRIAEQDNMSLTIEWIYNYFRSFYLFDETEGDFFGHVVVDTERNGCRNEYRRMSVDEFYEVAEAEICFAMLMASGGGPSGQQLS